jgi:hypothetical protein
MKRHIDLEKAAHAESLGALAVGSQRKHRSAGTAGRLFTAAQSRALSDLVRLLVEIAKDAGADHKRVTVRGFPSSCGRMALRKSCRFEQAPPFNSFRFCQSLAPINSSCNRA